MSKRGVSQLLLMAQIMGQGFEFEPEQRHEWTEVKDVDPEQVKAEIRARRASKKRRGKR